MPPHVPAIASGECSLLRPSGGGDGNRSAHHVSILFPLNCLRKVTQGCCDMNLSPPSLPSGQSLYLSVLRLGCSLSCFVFPLSLLDSRYHFPFFSFPPPTAENVSLTHSCLCQTGNVSGIYTAEPTGGLAAHYHE